MQVEKLQQALLHMQRALKMLDEGSAPSVIGCHLDLSICRLEEFLQGLHCQNEGPPDGPPSC